MTIRGVWKIRKRHFLTNIFQDNFIFDAQAKGTVQLVCAISKSYRCSIT